MKFILCIIYDFIWVFLQDISYYILVLWKRKLKGNINQYKNKILKNCELKKMIMIKIHVLYKLVVLYELNLYIIPLFPSLDN